MNRACHLAKCSAANEALVLCRLQEAELSEQAVAAIVKLSRESHIPTKLAAARATGNLLLADLDGRLPEGCAMEPLVPVLVALLGRDQNSEVQRQGLQVSQLALHYQTTTMFTAVGLCGRHGQADARLWTF